MRVSWQDVREIFLRVFNGEITREQAEEWAFARMEDEDYRNLFYEPPEDEDRIWEAIGYLYAIGLQNLPNEYWYSDEEIKEWFDLNDRK